MRDTREPETPSPAEPRFSGDAPPIPAWQPIVLGALAGGLGWGIRGQYGHETGAMIAGLLVTLTWMVLFLRRIPADAALRAVAWGTVAIGFGGAMTYGQTVGLTHDEALVGNGSALRWGMLGLAIKGSIWIGFCGLFLGMALGGRRYRAGELAAMFAGMVVLFWLGKAWLNEPFDPSNKILPRVYFSDDWRWEPGADLKPRREVWGGMLLALLGAVAYVGYARRDDLARRLAGWAMLAGALGFPAGQSLQAYHAWNREFFRTGAWASIDPILNWWNFMETTFGLVFGAVLGFGLWSNRDALRDAHRAASPSDTASLSNTTPAWAIGLLGIHVGLLVVSEFEILPIPVLDRYADFPLVMGLLPIVASHRGRLAAWLVALPITLLPIAGKTLRQLVYEQPTLSPTPGWLLYGIGPVAVALVLALRLARAPDAADARGRTFRVGLGFATLVYFALNYAFFRFPWPWATWTARTPNAIVFAFCAAALLTLACRGTRLRPRPHEETPRSLGTGA